jgi:hypothetical protein
MLQEVTILLILAELCSKMQLMRIFWIAGAILLLTNIGVILATFITGDSSFLSEKSSLWIALACIEMLIQVIIIFLG